MKKNNFVIATMFILLFLTSCSHEETIFTERNCDDIVEFIYWDIDGTKYSISSTEKLEELKEVLSSIKGEKMLRIGAI